MGCQVFYLPPHSGGYTRVPPVQPGPRGDRDAPWVVRYFTYPHTAAVTPESLRSSLGRGGIGTPRGFVRYFPFPHTAAVTPESLRSSLGRGGIGTPRGFVRYFPFTHTAAVTPESLRSSLGRGGIGTPRGLSGILPTPTQRRLHPSPSGPAWAAEG